MLSATLIAFRFFQYFGATILLGASLFFLYALPKDNPCAASALRWPKNLLIVSSLFLLAGALGGLVAQTGVLAGSIAEGFKIGNLQVVVTQMPFGWSNMIRAVVATIVLLCLIVHRASSFLWAECTIAGVLVCASLVWMGHGAATEGVAGYAHLAADALHSLAASVWIGALFSLNFLLLLRQNSLEHDQVLYRALRGFSGIGTTAVAVLIASGLVNSWFLVGLDRLESFWTTPYGQVLLAKLIIFFLMLALAASNRYVLTPRLGMVLESGAPPTKVLSVLRASLLIETAAALLILGLVAWLGTLAPVRTV